jgi:hypothetical protein
MFELFQSKPKDVPKRVQDVIAPDMTLEQVRTSMLQLMAEESINHHRMGVLFNYVVDRKLAELAGFKDAPDYFQKNLSNISPATLAAYGAVARNFSEEIARRFGVTCLSLLLSYKKAAKVEVDHEQPGSALIEVPDKKGVVASKPFSACSVDEMRRALQHLRQPSSGTALTPEDVALADRIDGAVMGCFQKGDPIRVQLRSHQGIAVLDIKAIPLAKWEKLKEALKALDLSPSAAPEGKPPATA